MTTNTKGQSLIVQCCVCFALRNSDNNWVAFPYKLPEASFTYCEECVKPLRKAINERRLKATKEASWKSTIEIKSSM